MKKRTKITLRTKIYLTIAGLLTLTGVLYASTPSIFVSPGHGLDTPIGLAADPDHLFSSQYNDNEVITIDCLGNGTLFGTLPAPIPPILTEKYMAIAPAQSTAAGFTPGDLFITLSQTVFTATPSVSGNFTLFATWAGVDGGCPNSDHSAITFDHEGTSFGNKMIITCEGGRVFTIDNLPGGPHVAHLTDTTTPQNPTNIEGPAVLPASFGPLGGQIMVADDINSNLYTINSAGTVNYNPFNVPPGTFSGAEQVLVIPEFPCAFCGDHAFFTASAGDNDITSYPVGDFTGLGGDILVTSEGTPPFGTFRVHFDVPSMSYQFFVFDGSALSKEGSTFVEGSCQPSPTPTPTATSTPTATATPTPQLQRRLLRPLQRRSLLLLQRRLLQRLPRHHITHQHLLAPRHHITHQHLPRHHITHQHLPRHHITHQHLPRHHITHQHLLRHHITHQHLPRHHITHQHLPRHHITQQHLPPQHITQQHLPPHHIIIIGGDGY